MIWKVRVWKTRLVRGEFLGPDVWKLTITLRYPQRGTWYDATRGIEFRERYGTEFGAIRKVTSTLRYIARGKSGGDRRQFDRLRDSR